MKERKNKMGYESRLYVVEHHESGFAEKIAVFDMCKMYYNGWVELFNKEFMGNLYADDGNTLIKEDNYGEKLSYAELDAVLGWLKETEEILCYRRIAPLIGYLEGIDKADWYRVKIVHYGY